MPRDEWKHLSAALKLDHLAYSLSSAPLTAAERNQIYQLINGKSGRAGYVTLADSGARELLVRGPVSASGNYPVWIFTRRDRRLHLILQTSGNAFLVSQRSHKGFHDVAAAWHRSAEEDVFRVYQWDGGMYAQTDCYEARFDLGRPKAPPRIQSCP